jgi:hypothetical protein
VYRRLLASRHPVFAAPPMSPGLQFSVVPGTMRGEGDVARTFWQLFTSRRRWQRDHAKPVSGHKHEILCTHALPSCTPNRKQILTPSDGPEKHHLWLMRHRSPWLNPRRAHRKQEAQLVAIAHTPPRKPKPLNRKQTEGTQPRFQWDPWDGCAMPEILPPVAHAPQVMLCTQRNATPLSWTLHPDPG